MRSAARAVRDVNIDRNEAIVDVLFAFLHDKSKTVKDAEHQDGKDLGSFSSPGPLAPTLAVRGDPGRHIGRRHSCLW